MSGIESIGSTIDTLDPDHSYNVVLGGDFNFIQDTVLDSVGGKPSFQLLHLFKCKMQGTLLIYGALVTHMSSDLLSGKKPLSCRED